MLPIRPIPPRPKLPRYFAPKPPLRSPASRAKPIQIRNRPRRNIWLSAIGYRLLAIGYWLSAIGYPQAQGSGLRPSPHLSALSALGRGPGSGPIHPISPSIPMQILAARKYPTPRIIPHLVRGKLPGMGCRLGHAGNLRALGNQSDDIFPTPGRPQCPNSDVTHNRLRVGDLSAYAPTGLP